MGVKIILMLTDFTVIYLLDLLDSNYILIVLTDIYTIRKCLPMSKFIFGGMKSNGKKTDLYKMTI
jgi:hypothetical protein